MSLAKFLYELSDSCKDSPPDHDCRVLVIGRSGYKEPRDVHIETGWYDAERGHWCTDGMDHIEDGWPTPLLYVVLSEDEQVDLSEIIESHV